MTSTRLVPVFMTSSFRILFVLTPGMKKRLLSKVEMVKSGE